MEYCVVGKAMRKTVLYCGSVAVGGIQVHDVVLDESSKLRVTKQEAGRLRVAFVS